MLTTLTNKLLASRLIKAVLWRCLAGVLIFLSASGIQAQDPFITTWQVTAGNLSITIPTNTLYGYNYSVNWGDGNTNTGMGGDSFHTYSSAGTYTVSISGTFPSIYFLNSDATNKAKIRTVQQWGDIAWASLAYAFAGCINLRVPATDGPDLSNVEGIDFMFWGATSFNQPINHWDVSKVTNMNGMFRETGFNQPLNNWDVSSVTSMFNMFFRNRAFNQDVSNWDVSSVTTMRWMFFDANAFNQPIGNWDVSNVTSFEATFNNATSFNQALGNWDISSATNMSEMLNNTAMSDANFDASLNGWQILTGVEQRVPIGITLGANGLTFTCEAKVAFANLSSDYGWNFTGYGTICSPFSTNWITSDGQITIPIFSGETYDYDIFWYNLTNPGTAEGYDGGLSGGYTITGLENGSTYRVDISRVFPRIYFNNSGDINKIQNVVQWSSNSWTSMANAFMGCNSLTIEDAASPNLSNVTDLSFMFAGAAAMNSTVDNWDVSGVINMSHMFDQASLFNQSLANWDIGQVTDMTAMLSGTNLSIEQYDATIDAWGTLTGGESQIPENVALGSDGLHFCGSRLKRQELIDDFGWTFVGDAVSISSKPVPDVSNLPALISATAIESLNPPTAKGNCGTVILTGATPVQLPITQPTTISWTYTDEFGNQTIQEQYAFVGRPFVTTWNAINLDDGYFVQIPVDFDRLEGYYFSVDWGDASLDNTVYTGELIGNNGYSPFHGYSEAGTYTVSIYGAFPALYYPDAEDYGMLQTIEQWGDIEWKSMRYAFAGAYNLVYNATDVPNLQGVTSLEGMFQFCEKFNGAIGNWNVSTITNMGWIFHSDNGPMIFNQDISAWDVSKVTHMHGMFRGCVNFNQDLSVWNVSRVANMRAMFAFAASFDQNLGAWNIGAGPDVFNMLNSSGLSVKNYTRTLNGWSAQAGIAPFKTLGAAGLKYCDTDGTGHADLIALGWIINDAGTSCPLSPELNAIGNKSIDEETKLVFTASAAPGDFPFTYKLDVLSLTKGMAINETTGEFSWMPTTMDVGEHTVTLTADDGEYGDSETFTITVMSVNDPPVLASNAGLNLSQGQKIAITNAMLNVMDEDNTAQEIIFTLTSAPTNGTLLKNEIAIASGGTFTQSDINAGLLKYDHNGFNGTSDKFTFTVSDGKGGTIAASDFNITVDIITGLERLTFAHGISVFPNPTAVSATISISNNYIGMLQISLTDVTGRNVLQLEAFKNEETIHLPVNLSSVPNGLLMVHTRAGNRLTTVKVIKK